MTEIVRPVLNGLLTGLLLQLAVGPVFFFILGITVDSGFINTLSAILAVTLADYIYIVLSLAGIGRWLERDRVKAIFGLVSAVVLIMFGCMILYKGLSVVPDAGLIRTVSWTPFSSFTSCFLLTISSPLTIAFWGSVFSAKAVEKNYRTRQLVVFGLGTGLATFLFLSVTMVILFFLKTGIPEWTVRWLNGAVGLALIGYGVTRTVACLSGREKMTAPKRPLDSGMS